MSRSMLRPWRRGSRGRGLLAAGAGGRGRERLRALPAHRRAARAAEDGRRVGAPRRAALPDRPPVLGALAQARLERRRGGDRHLARGEVAPALRLLRRSALCLQYATTQLDMLEQMSPWEYQEIRKVLGHGSGFDSPGWREIRRVTPLLGQAFHALREQAGLSLVDVYVRGREHEELYQLAEALIEWDERINLWRIRHYKVVARIIGDSRRRHAGHAGRGARPADPPRLLPGALAGAQRADRALAGGGLMFDELKAKQSVMWGNGPLRADHRDLLTDVAGGSRRARSARSRTRGGSTSPPAPARSRGMARASGADVTGARPRAGSDRDGAPPAVRRQRASRSSSTSATPRRCPYDDASFDVVVSTFGVMFAPDHAAVARELARVLPPGWPARPHLAGRRTAASATSSA